MNYAFKMMAILMFSLIVIIGNFKLSLANKISNCSDCDHINRATKYELCDAYKNSTSIHLITKKGNMYYRYLRVEAEVNRRGLDCENVRPEIISDYIDEKVCNGMYGDDPYKKFKIIQEIQKRKIDTCSSFSSTDAKKFLDNVQKISQQSESQVNLTWCNDTLGSKSSLYRFPYWTSNSCDYDDKRISEQEVANQIKKN